MKKVVFALNWFGSPEARPYDEVAMGRLLDAYVELNRSYIRKVGKANVPWLYSAGIRYERDPPGEELWQTIPVILQSGGGDCEDLAAYRCSELIERCGEPAKILARGRKLPNGHLLYHILVRRASGEIEDPSLVLGMP